MKMLIVFGGAVIIGLTLQHFGVPNWLACIVAPFLWGMFVARLAR